MEFWVTLKVKFTQVKKKRVKQGLSTYTEFT